MLKRNCEKIEGSIKKGILEYDIKDRNGFVHIISDTSYS